MNEEVRQEGKMGAGRSCTATVTVTVTVTGMVREMPLTLILLLKDALSDCVRQPISPNYG